MKRGSEALGILPSMRKAYQTDLSDAEWSCLEPHVPAPKANGRPRVYPLREILDAVFYVVRSGCAWRLLPHDFPPWKTVQIVSTQMAKRLVRAVRRGRNYVMDLDLLVADDHPRAADLRGPPVLLPSTASKPCGMSPCAP